MFNPLHYENSQSDGVALLQVVTEGEEQPQFVPLRDTTVRGTITGPLADLQVIHRFGYERAACDRTLEARYRFPLPGDAAVMAVTVRFGATEIVADLKERRAAEEEYAQARAAGRQTALATRESADAFTLQLAGLQPDQEIVIETRYVQLVRAEGEGWALRIPLTLAPRYARRDELAERAAQGQPLAIVRNPRHRFRLDLSIHGAGDITSPTHPLTIEQQHGVDRVTLAAGAVIPDRDCLITWRAAAVAAQPLLTAFSYHDPAAGYLYFVAQVAPPAMHMRGQGVAREIILLVDHSGSMTGPKWAAADWAVERFLADLSERDRFALGFFHNTTHWFKVQTEVATVAARRQAVTWLKEHRESGGTELGMALEQALHLNRTSSEMARHLLIITDAEVTDAARILRLAESEAGRTDRRRISVLCIDAAPNAYLAQELADWGGGVARFLTSDPDQEDIATALDEVLADWAEPVLAGLSLVVNRPQVEASGRQTTTTEPGQTVIDLGDLVSGRALWVVARTPQAEPAPLKLTLWDAQQQPLTERTLRPDQRLGTPALKALFGARRVSALEHLIAAGYDEDALRPQLARLGYDPTVILGGGEHEGSPIYSENRQTQIKNTLRTLLRDEALGYGLASSETAFVATRREAGQVVEEAIDVASALPSGWSPDFLSQPATLRASAGAGLAAQALPMPAVSMAPPDLGLAQGMRRVVNQLFAGQPQAKSRGVMAPDEEQTTLFTGAPAWRGQAALLFDTEQTPDLLPDYATLTAIRVQATGLSPEAARQVQLLIHLGDPTRPRAQVTLADLLQLGERPLNLRRQPGQPLTVSLHDPSGVLAQQAISLTVELRWRRG
jgi:Ca-activated chloride channel homolog